MRSRSERLATFGTGILTLFIFIVLYAPVFISILFSVVEIKKGQILWETFSLTPYASLWLNPSVISALSNTAVVAVISVAISSVCAVILALYTNWEEAIGGRALEVIIYLPFLLPPIVTGLSLLVVSSQLGISRSLATIVLGHSLFVLAVSYRLALTRLQALPKSLVEASFDLGASRLQTLRYVLLPHLASAVMTGAVLALTLSFDETLITTFVAGDQMTLPLRLWAMMRVGFTPEINALVTLVLLISIGLSVIVAWRMRPQGEVEEE